MQNVFVSCNYCAHQPYIILLNSLINSNWIHTYKKKKREKNQKNVDNVIKWKVVWKASKILYIGFKKKTILSA